MKLKPLLPLIFTVFFISAKSTNIDSVVTWSYYQGWYKSARSYYYYTGAKIDSVISWSYYQGWYQSGRSFYYGTATKTDSINTWSYYQGWYLAARSFNYYSGLKMDSAQAYSYYQGWYLSSRTLYTYMGNCIDSLVGYTFNQGWYESTRSHYYNSGNCQADSVYTKSYYQGWYDSGRDYYYYGPSTAGISSNKKESGTISSGPNPVQNKLNIYAHPELLSEVKNVEIYSLGSQKQNADYRITPKASIELDTEHLAPGVFLYRIITARGIYTGKFIRE